MMTKSTSAWTVFLMQFFACDWCAFGTMHMLFMHQRRMHRLRSLIHSTMPVRTQSTVKLWYSQVSRQEHLVYSVEIYAASVVGLFLKWKS